MSASNVANAFMVHWQNGPAGGGLTGVSKVGVRARIIHLRTSVQEVPQADFADHASHGRVTRK